MNATKKRDPMEPMKSASEEVKSIIKEVLKLEAEKLYQQRPHINADIVRIIKEAVK